MPRPPVEESQNQDTDLPAPIRRLQLAVPRMALARAKDGGELLLVRLPFGRVYAARLGASEVLEGELAKSLAKIVDSGRESPPKKRRASKRTAKKKPPAQPS